jgi:FdhD protein
VRALPRRIRSIDLTQVAEWEDGRLRRLEDYLAGEEPLEIRCGRNSLGVTMRTPGHDVDLTTGFLFTEGIISRREQLLSLKTLRSANGSDDANANVMRVRLARDVRIEKSRLSRAFSAGSACGLCGKQAIADVRSRGVRRPDPASRFDPHLLCQLPEKLRAAQAIFGRTGGLHAAGLFDAKGELLVLREDIGRHNAVDKVIGWALMEGRIPLAGHAMLVSGRGGFEIVQKVLMAGIPLLASVSAPSSLAVQLARELNLTFVGFLRGRRFVIYSGEERLGVSSEKTKTA